MDACLDCAATDSWFHADDDRSLPTLLQIERARKSAEATAAGFAGDVTGWPRPTWERPTNGDDTDDRHSDPDDSTPLAARLPVPWINGQHGLEGDFFSFRDDALRSVEDRLCAVCGDQMLGDIALGAMNHRRVSSGGWCHPRCLAVAVRMCPHFTRDNTGTIAWRYRGPGVGLVYTELSEDPVSPCATPLTVGELTTWAHDDPWGLATEGQQERCLCR